MKNKSMAFAFVLMATIAGLAGAQQGGSDALPTLSWSGPWSQSGENRFVSNAIGHGGETWQMLTINAPAGGRLWVTLTASSEADFDFGIASALNGARSASEYQIRVSGAESETLLYDLPPGSHVIHFGYAKDNSVNSRNDRVTVEVEVSAPGVSVAPTLSWSGPWSRSGENRFVSDAIGHDQETWQTLTINAPAGGRIWVTLTASSEDHYDFGVATALNGSISDYWDDFRMEVSGTESETVLYIVPPGTHAIHFGYLKDGSVSAGNDQVIVEVSAHAIDASPAPATLSWYGPWLQSAENRYVSNRVGHDEETWQILVINAPEGSRVRVTLTASSEEYFDFGVATRLNGARSDSLGDYQMEVSGTESRSLVYDVPPGTHAIHFGYLKDGSLSQGNDQVIVEAVVE